MLDGTQAANKPAKLYYVFFQLLVLLWPSCCVKGVKVDSNLRRNGLQASAVLVAFVVDQAEFAKEDRQHAQVLLQLPQAVLMCVRMVRDAVR